jgi:predicted DNA-binding transcriptional regulator AlpA
VPTTHANNPIPEVSDQPVMTARDMFGPLGMSDTTGYALIKRGEFPIALRRVGGRWMGNTIDLRRHVGLDLENS